MDKMKSWITEEDQYCAHNYHPLPMVLERGEGVWLWDIEGKRYLDMMSAYSAVSLGHCHPQLVAVLAEQSHKLCLVSRAFHSAPLMPFLKKLCAVSGMDMALPMNTGVEAVETALKAARRWGYEKKGIAPNQAQIIVAQHNFHGRTVTVTGFSSEALYKKDFGPFTPGFIEIPFGDAKALAQAIQPETCAFLVEPIQGEAGIIVPPADYLQQCREICSAHNILLILDEVQSGLGRTGSWFAFEHAGIQPDGLIVGKALGGGILPVSAFLANHAVMDCFTPGSHGSTFGGNPLAARIGLETLLILESEHLIQNSRLMGERLITGLKKLVHPGIKKIRGQGLWVGVEFDPERVSARAVCEALAENGILTKEVHHRVVRFAPPLIIQAEEIDYALQQFHQVLKRF